MRVPHVLAIGAVLALAGCNALPNQAALGPPRSTTPAFGNNAGPPQPPGSLPPGFTTADPITTSIGVVGVTHDVP